MSEPSKPPIRRQARPIIPFDGKIAGVSITKLDWALSLIVVGFLALVILQALSRELASPFALMRETHFHLSRFGLAIAGVMFALALYIGNRRKGDVTPYFRRGVYVIVGTMLLEALIGLAMYMFIGARPHDEVHLIYGMATVLALPFFIFVEVTAEKRPAIASYAWGFAILAGVIIRSIGTGAA